VLTLQLYDYNCEKNTMLISITQLTKIINMLHWKVRPVMKH